jgi:hypothetical protein
MNLAGLLYVALSHPVLGRPLGKALAYGSSIPHIDTADLLSLNIVRLSKGVEEKIANSAEQDAELRAKADLEERALAGKASLLIQRIIAGETSEFTGLTCID